MREYPVAKHRVPEPEPTPESDLEGCSLEQLYSAEYLESCATPEAREERIAELKRRIEARAYNVDADRIAEELIARGELSES